MVKNHQSGGSVMAGGNISIVLQPCGTSLGLSALLCFFEGNVRCDDGEEQEEHRVDCLLQMKGSKCSKILMQQLLVFTLSKRPCCLCSLVFTCLCSLACVHDFQEAMRDSTTFRASAE